MSLHEKIELYVVADERAAIRTARPEALQIGKAVAWMGKSDDLASPKLHQKGGTD